MGDAARANPTQSTTVLSDIRIYMDTNSDHFTPLTLCVQGNEPAIRYGQVRDRLWVKSEAGSNNFAEYKPKYFSRRDKSAKSTYF